MLVREKIRLLRLSKNWTQEYIAEQLGMSPNGYGEIERGKTRITVDKLDELSQLFDVSLSELCDDEKTNVFIAHNHGVQAQQNNQSHCTICSKSEKHENEKLQLVVEKLESMVEAQRTEISYLKEIIELMKK